MPFPIKAVSRNRVPQRSHMGADLMRASGPDADLEKREPREALERLPVRHGAASRVQPRRHPRAIPRIARNRFMDAAGSVKRSFHERQVDLLNRARLELGGQIPMGGVRLRDQQHARSESVESMHDTRTQIAANGREQVESMQQRVDHSARLDAGSGVHHHSGGFVDGNHTVVFIKNGERNVFGCSLQSSQRRGLDTDLFRTSKNGGRLARSPIDLHAAIANPALQSRPAVFRQLPMQKGIQPRASILRFRFQDHDGRVSSGRPSCRRHCAIRMQLAPIAELITAEGTVVERKSEQAKQTPQRIPAGSVDLIRPRESCQFAIVAKRALAPLLEDGKEGPVEVVRGVAMFALKRGCCEDLEYKVPVAA